MILTTSYRGETLRAFERILGMEGAELHTRLTTLIKPYESFRIPKGDGGPGRLIEAPVPALRQIQRRLLDSLFYRVPVGPSAHGFVPGRSIVSHARAHCGQRQMIGFDLEKAFPSVSRQRVASMLDRRVGTILKHRMPRFDRVIRRELRDLICDLVTYQDHLPQGAPTSGAVLNLVLAPLDRSMCQLIKAWQAAGAGRLVYTRYADDLNLSAEGVLPEDAERQFRKAIHRAGFRFNPRKVCRADRAKGQALEFCGVQVEEDRLRLSSRRLRRYRAVFHRAFHEAELSRARKGELLGIAGLVLMVHGCWPSMLKSSWELVAARHELRAGSTTKSAPNSGYAP